MANEYYPGQGVVVQAIFYDEDGAVITPSAVTLKYRRPDSASVVTVGPISPSTVEDIHDANVQGYTATIDTTNGPAGDWWYRFEGTGTALGANEGTFYVLPSRVNA